MNDNGENDGREEARQLGTRMAYIRRAALHPENTIRMHLGETIETKIGTIQRPDGKWVRGLLRPHLHFKILSSRLDIPMIWFFTREVVQASEQDPTLVVIRHLSATIAVQLSPEQINLQDGTGEALKEMIFEPAILGLMFVDCDPDLLFKVDVGEELTSENGEKFTMIVLHAVATDPAIGISSGIAAVQSSSLNAAAMHGFDLEGSGGQGVMPVGPGGSLLSADVKAVHGPGAQEGDIIPVEIEITSADGQTRTETVDGRVVRVGDA